MNNQQQYQNQQENVVSNTSASVFSYSTPATSVQIGAGNSSSYLSAQGVPMDPSSNFQQQQPGGQHVQAVNNASYYNQNFSYSNTSAAFENCAQYSAMNFQQNVANYLNPIGPAYQYGADLGYFNSYNYLQQQQYYPCQYYAFVPSQVIETAAPVYSEQNVGLYQSASQVMGASSQVQQQHINLLHQQAYQNLTEQPNRLLQGQQPMLQGQQPMLQGQQPITCIQPQPQMTYFFHSSLPAVRQQPQVHLIQPNGFRNNQMHSNGLRSSHLYNDLNGMFNNMMQPRPKKKFYNKWKGGRKDSHSFAQNMQPNDVIESDLVKENKDVQDGESDLKENKDVHEGEGIVT